MSLEKHVRIAFKEMENVANDQQLEKILLERFKEVEKEGYKKGVLIKILNPVQIIKSLFL